MTVDEYWAAIKAMGLRGAHRGSPDVDYMCTTRDGEPQQVTDPERLDADGRAAVIRRLRTWFDYSN
jgi:hypothetical protein